MYNMREATENNHNTMQLLSLFLLIIFVCYEQPQKAVGCSTRFFEGLSSTSQSINLVLVHVQTRTVCENLS